MGTVMSAPQVCHNEQLLLTARVAEAACFCLFPSRLTIVAADKHFSDAATPQWL
jgi:hypothetical protein